jgi:Domain of unknown function (DUF4177)
MRKSFIIASVAVCLLGGVVILTAKGEPQPAEAKAKVEYKALVRTDIEALAPEAVKKNGHIEGSNTEALAAGLNALAKDGWELVTIEAYSEQQGKEVKTTVTYRHYPTYVFKRPAK